jgi:hypothetical protein
MPTTLICIHKTTTYVKNRPMISVKKSCRCSGRMVGICLPIWIRCRWNESHQMLKMFASQGPGFEFSQEELKNFLQRKVREHKLVYAGRLSFSKSLVFFKLNKNLLSKKICVNFVTMRPAHRHHRRFP